MKREKLRLNSVWNGQHLRQNYPKTGKL